MRRRDKERYKYRCACVSEHECEQMGARGVKRIRTTVKHHEHMQRV